MTEEFRISSANRQMATDVCVLITDGPSNSDSHRTIPDAEDAKTQGIKMVVLGVGSRAAGSTGRREVEAMASADMYFLVERL